MVTFGEIISKTVRVPYFKEDLPGYKVSGSVAYDKDNALTDANGNIQDASSGDHIANFNIYGSNEDVRINLTDCIPGRMSDAVSLAEATLADLAASSPEV